MAYTYKYVGTNSANNVYNNLSGSIEMYGNGGNDTLKAYQYAAYNDYLSGDSGDDKLYAYAGNDTMVGGSGNDRAEGGEGNDTIYGDLGNLASTGGGADQLVGGNGIDKLYGESGNDTLSGGAQTDYLYGGSGNDKLYGMSGSDYLAGGSGYDSFYFQNSNGNDRVDDYQWGVDDFYVDIDGFSRFSQLSITNDSNGDARVSFGSQGSVTITGYSALEISQHQSDWHFI